jgi:hypothetical protein
MAVIGSVTSDFLAPGVSRNGRLYTPEIIRKAVARMQERLADPDGLPLTMLSHHDAGDDSKELVGRIVSVELDEDTDVATLDGYLIDTAAGKDIASATEPDDQGRRVLDSMSIRGWWLGPVRYVEVDGESCETGDDIEVNGVDFTKDPGVLAARIRGSSRSRSTTEASARTPITETVEATLMTDRIAGKPSPADMPGARRPARSSSPAAAQETAPGPHPLAEVLAKLREAHVAIGGWQGPVDLDLSAWGLSNDDVAAAATKLGAAYTAALTVLDPDNDGDLDLPEGDVGECAACQADLPAGALFCPACGTAVAEDDDQAEETAGNKEDTEVADKQNGASEGAAGAGDGATTTTETGKPAEETREQGGEQGKATTEDADATAAGSEGTAAADAGTPARLHPDDLAAITGALTAALTPAPAAAAPQETAGEQGKPAQEATPDKPAAQAAPAAPALDPQKLAEAVAATVVQASKETREAVLDQVRKEFLEAYGTPRRAGLVESAKKAAGDNSGADKPLHDMDPAEFLAHTSDVWAGVLPAPEQV